MPLPLEDHVRQVLLENDRGIKFFMAVRDGWAALDELYPQRHRWRRKSTARHMVWEEVVQRLYEVAAADTDIVPIEHRDTVSLVVENEVLFRLKYADTGLITRNYPTPEAESFDDHSVDLYGFSGLQRVKLCYVPDEYESSLLWTGIAASNKGKFLWKIELEDSGAVEAPASLPFPEAEVDTTRLARLRGPQENPQKKNRDNG